MDSDLYLSIGVILFVLSLPSLLAAWTEGRAPRIGAIMIIAGTAMIVAAVLGKPGGYAFNEVPTVMLKVAGRLVN